MNTILNIVRKDLRHSVVALSSWGALQLVLNVSILVLERRPEASLSSPDGMVVASLAVLLNAVLACLFTVRLIGEDSPLLEEGTWRTLPVRPWQMATAKLCGSLVGALLPAVLALLPCLLWLGCDLSLICQSLLAVSLVQVAACVLACAASVLTGRGSLATLLQLLGALGLAYVFFMLSIKASLRPIAPSWLKADPVALSRYTLCYCLLGVGALGTLYVFYSSARRLAALSALAATLALSLSVLHFWSWPLLEGTPVQLTASEVRMEQTGASVRRFTLISGIPENQRFKTFNATGYIGLGRLREKAMVVGWVGTLPKESPAMVFQMYKLGDGGLFETLPRDVFSADFPTGRSEICRVLSPYKPSLEDQVLVRPSLDLCVEGELFTTRELARFRLSERRVNTVGGLYLVTPEARLGDTNQGVSVRCYQSFRYGRRPQRELRMVPKGRDGLDSDTKLNAWVGQEHLSIGLLQVRTLGYEVDVSKVDLATFEFVEGAEPIVGRAFVRVTAPECTFTARGLSQGKLDAWQAMQAKRSRSPVSPWMP